MDKFGLGDLAWIGLLVAIAAVAMSGWPEEIFRRCAPTVRAFLRGEIIQIHVKSEDYGVSHGGIEGDLDGMEPAVPEVVLARPDAADTGTRIPAPDDLSRAELLDILVRQRADGRYVFSANKLAELLANTPHAVSRNILLEEIAAIRKADQPPTPKPLARLERPAGGW